MYSSHILFCSVNVVFGYDFGWFFGFHVAAVIRFGVVFSAFWSCGVK
jgi:hypothetical protein